MAAIKTRREGVGGGGASSSKNMPLMRLILIAAFLACHAIPAFAKPPSGTALDTGHALYTNLELALGLLEGSGSTSADAAGADHGITLDSGASWTTISGEAALTFNGGVNADAGMAAAIALSDAENWSIAWRGKQTTSGTAGIFLNGHSVDTQNFLFYSGGSLFRFRNDNNVSNDFNPPTAFTADHNYLLTFENAASSGTLRLYVDGTESTNSPKTSVDGVFTVNRLGGQNSSSSALNGTITYVYVWKGRLLTSSDATALNAAPYDVFDYDPPAVTITSPDARALQRNGSDQATVTLAGTFDSGNAAEPLEWNFDGGSYTAVTSEGSNAFSETITLPVGQGVIRVRFVGDTAKFDESNIVTVGDGWIIAGQSNAEGRLTNAQTHTGTYTCVAYNQNDAWIIDNTDPFDPGSTTGSWIPLLCTLLEADTSTPHFFITTADGSTGLVNPTHWDPSGTSNSYDGMVAQASQAAVGGGYKAVLFYQGESDLINDVTENDYLAGLQELATAIASDVAGAPPLVVMQVGHDENTSQPSTQFYRAAVRRAWDAGGGILGGPAMYDQAFDLHPATDAHGLTIAKRFYAAIKSEILGGTSGAGRGPRLVSATPTSGTVVKVTFDKALKTGLTFGTGAWRVSDSGGAKTISGVAYHGTDPNAVDVTVTTALGASPVISLGKNNHAVGVVVPKGPDFTLPDASTINLPAEAFFDAPIRSGGGFLPLLSVIGQ